MDANKYLGIFHPPQIKWTGRSSATDTTYIPAWIACPAQTPEKQMECKYYETGKTWYCRHNDNGCSDACLMSEKNTGDKL